MILCKKSSTGILILNTAIVVAINLKIQTMNVVNQYDRSLFDSLKNGLSLPKSTFMYLSYFLITLMTRSTSFSLSGYSFFSILS